MNVRDADMIAMLIDGGGRIDFGSELVNGWLGKSDDFRLVGILTPSLTFMFIDCSAQIVQSFKPILGVVVTANADLPAINWDDDWDTPIMISLQRTLMTALQQIKDGNVTLDSCLESLRDELAKRKHEHKLLHRDLTELLEATSEAE